MQWLSTASALKLGNRSYLYRTAPSLSTFRLQGVRALSSEAKKEGKETSDQQEGDSKEIVLTPGQKVVAASRLTMWAGIAAFAAVCGFYIVKELMPTKMSPNRVFDKSFDVVRNDPEVKRRYGDKVKAYGRDHGGHREGRRNFIEHKEYVDEQDGSKRTRVRYNLEGQFGRAFVFAEVSNKMPSGEFVYILVQDKSNGRTHTVIDNRSAMTASRLAGDNKEASSAMSQLLTGGSKK